MSSTVCGKSGLSALSGVRTPRFLTLDLRGLPRTWARTTTQRARALRPTCRRPKHELYPICKAERAGRAWLLPSSGEDIGSHKSRASLRSRRRLHRNQAVMECKHSPLLREVLPLPVTLGASDDCFQPVLRCLRLPLTEALQLQSGIDELILDVVLPPWTVRLTDPVLELWPTTWTAMLVHVLAEHIADSAILTGQILPNCGSIHKHLTPYVFDFPGLRAEADSA